jgi:hypothetical protein
MRPKMIALASVAVLLVAVGATAYASGGGGPLGFLHGDPDQQRAQYATDLAGQLGIDKNRVEKAMQDVEKQRRDAFENEQAKALADKLGVSEADAKKALEAGFAAIRDQGKPPAQGERPDSPFLKAVADSLNKDIADVRKALRDIQRDKLESKLDEAVKSGRLTKEQADRIRKRIESGNGKNFGPPGHRGFGAGAPGPGAGGPPGGGPPPGFGFQTGPPPAG